MPNSGLKNFCGIAKLTPVLCLITLVSICLVPYIPISLQFYIRLEDILLPIVFLVVLPLIKMIRYWYFVMLFIWTIYGVITMAINGRLAVFNDYTEIYKLFKYSCYLLLFFQFFQLKKNVFFTISIVFSVLVVFNLFHFYNILDFNKTVMPSYVTNSFQLEFFGKNSLGGPATKRILGTMGNPNINAILFSFFVIYFMPFLTNIKWHWGKLFFFLALAMLLMTQSRTCMLAFVIFFPVYLILKKVKWITTIKLLVFITLTLIVVKLADEYSLNYVSDAKFNVVENGSLRGRLEVWTELGKMILEKPIFGYGINKNYFYEHNLYAENEYILITWRYGIIGLFFYLIMLFGPLVYYRKKWLVDRSSMSMIYLMIVILFGINALTNTPTSDAVLVLILSIATGGFLSQYILHEEIEISKV